MLSIYLIDFFVIKMITLTTCFLKSLRNICLPFFFPLFLLSCHPAFFPTYLSSVYNVPQSVLGLSSNNRIRLPALKEFPYQWGRGTQGDRQL